MGLAVGAVAISPCAAGLCSFTSNFKGGEWPACSWVIKNSAPAHRSQRPLVSSAKPNAKCPLPCCPKASTALNEPGQQPACRLSLPLLSTFDLHFFSMAESALVSALKLSAHGPVFFLEVSCCSRSWRWQRREGTCSGGPRRQQPPRGQGRGGGPRYWGHRR